MKIQISVGVGLVECNRKSTIEIDDDALEGLTDAGRENFIEECAKEHMFSMINWNWEKVED